MFSRRCVSHPPAYKKTNFTVTQQARLLSSPGHHSLSYLGAQSLPTMQYMKDAMSSAKDAGKALTGKKGYSDNLLGESLPDLLRRATAKELIIPDVSVNQQVSAR